MLPDVEKAWQAWTSSEQFTEYSQYQNEAELYYRFTKGDSFPPFCSLSPSSSHPLITCPPVMYTYAMGDLSTAIANLTELADFEDDKVVPETPVVITREWVPSPLPLLLPPFGFYFCFSFQQMSISELYSL